MFFKPDVEPLEHRICFSAPSGPSGPGVDASVAARHVFYNQSVFDQFDAAANDADDAAIAPDKAPLLPGEAASPANYTSYWHGINGVMIDVAGLAAAPTLEDFVFRVGSSPDASTWAAAPAPASITVRPAAGTGASDRVTLVWPNGAIKNQWLQVTVLETSRTGLPAPDVFYFGNLIADTGDAAPGAAATVDTRDLLRTRADRTRRQTAGPDNRSDHNRDARVNAKDLLLVRRYRTLPGRNGPLSPLSAAAEPPVYYVSPSGDDANDGLSPSRPWRTASKVNSAQLPPGAHVLFMRGGEWREQLRPSTGGTPALPVVFGSYGSGMKPKFWGSDEIAPASFEPAGEAGVYRVTLPQPTTVNSVQADHSFLRSAKLAAGTGPDPFDFVMANGRSWFQDASGTLYVNAGTDDPRTGAVRYTASVRQSLVHIENIHDVRVRNLVTDESAAADWGYGFAVVGSDNVTIEDSEAYRAGKHHIGAVNSNNFVGRRLYAAWAMPDQGFGGASAYVSYSDRPLSEHSSRWVDVTSHELTTMPYPAFLNHGPSLGELVLENFVARGGLAVQLSTKAPGQRVRMLGGLVEDTQLTLDGANILVDGVTIRGSNAALRISGEGHVVQNILVEGALPREGYFAAIADWGLNNTVRFSTIRLDPLTPAHSAALAVTFPETSTNFYGNIIDAPAAVRLWFQGNGAFRSDYNLFAQPPRFVRAPDQTITYDEWQATGRDLHSVTGDPMFVNPAAGDYRLRPGSPAIDAFAGAETLTSDFDRRPRPVGPALDLGAFEFDPGVWARIGNSLTLDVLRQTP